jgi:protein-glutamine gamma-glutamyltransferase
VAMRVRFPDGRVPTPEQLYFRGPVLAAFDGREWTRLPATLVPPARSRSDVTLIGASLPYEVTLEPTRMTMLPLLEYTPDRTDAAPRLEGMSPMQRGDGQWQTNQPITERLRFEARAWPIFRQGPRNDFLGTGVYTQLPEGYNSRTLAWARDFRSADPVLAGADARILAEALYKHIATADYTYTLEPGNYGPQAIDEFWLDRKLGFCEHFATAFVVIMRAWDVPARIVTGFQGSDPQPVDGWWVIRNSHAHAWAEYWQPGEGWVRADPTASVAPDRIRRGLHLQPPRGLMEQTINRVNPELLTELRAAWERFDNRWNQWVLNYSRGKQFNLLQRLGFDSPGWTELSYVLILLLSAAAGGAALWALWDRQRQDPWLRLQHRVQLRLAELGVPVGPQDAPRARALRVRAVLGPAGDELAQALDALDLARYGRKGLSRVDGRWWAAFKAAAARVQAPALREALAR